MKGKNKIKQRILQRVINSTSIPDIDFTNMDMSSCVSWDISDSIIARMEEIFYRKDVRSQRRAKRIKSKFKF